MEIQEAIGHVEAYNEANQCGGFLEAMMEMQIAYMELEQPYRLAYRTVMEAGRQMFAPTYMRDPAV